MPQAPATVPRGLLILDGIAAATIGVAGLSLSVLLAVARLATLLPSYEDEFASLVGNLGDWLASAGVGAESAKTVLSGLDLGALVRGLLAFVTNVIPNIGFVIGLVPPAILALLDSGVGPMVAGDVVGLSTSITGVSLVFWAWVLGPLAALLAIPLSWLLRSLRVDVDTASQWARPLMSGARKPS